MMKLWGWMLILVGVLGTSASCHCDPERPGDPAPPVEPVSPSPDPEPTPLRCPALEILRAGPQLTVWEDGTVAMAIPLEITGDRVVTDATVTALSLEGGRLLEPATLPVRVGVLQPHHWRTVDARFEVPADGAKRRLTLGLRFLVGKERCETERTATVQPSPPAMGPVESVPITLPKLDASKTTWPTPPPRPRDRPGPNAENLPVPPGPPRDLMTVAPPELRLASVPDLPGEEPLHPSEQGANTMVFTRNGQAGNYGGTPPDPSVAATTHSGVVMISANTAVSWSQDWGQSFTMVPLSGTIDPRNPARTSFFPAHDGGLCCDQVLTYSAKHDRFIWVIQTWPTPTANASGTLVNGPNRLFVAWTSPAALVADFANAWTWVELDSALFGLGNDWMDYPDVTVSDDFVYLSVDPALFGTSQLRGGRIYARLSLADMVRPGAASVGGAFVDLRHTGLVKGHIARGSKDAMYFGGLPNTSTVRAYQWSDESTSVGWFDVPMTSYVNPTSSTAPDGVGWNRAPAGILGSATAVHQELCFGGGACDSTPRQLVWVAFSAGANATAGRPQPYVRITAIDVTRRTLHSEFDMWNGSVAASAPSIYATCPLGRCDVALAMAVGGASQWPETAVGFVGDGIVYSVTASDATQHWNCAPAGQATAVLCSRHGDYFNVMPSQGPPTRHGNGVGYSTLGYAVRATTAGQTCAVGGCTVQLQYVQFGRDGALVPQGRPR